jgi:hypothetical protein
MTGEDKWGPGSEFKSFDTVLVGNTVMELGWGEHPHSRQDNRMYVREPGGTITGFDGHRILVKVVVESSNYMKESELSGDEVRKWCTATIYFNGVVARKLEGRDPERLLLRAHNAISDLMEMSYSVWHDGSSLIGRKIYWHHTPAIIKSINTDTAELFIIPAEGQFPPSPWAIEKDDSNNITDWLADYGNGMRINDNDPAIWWWRDNG